MRIIGSLAAAIVLATAAQISFGSEDASESQYREEAEEMYRLSGLELQADEIGPEILAGFKNSGVPLPDNVIEVIGDVIREEFADDILKDRAIDIIASAWNVELADISRDWLTSDFGRRIIEIEEYAATEAGMTGMEVYVAELEQNPPTESRDALVNHLNAVYGGTDFVVDVTLAIGLAVAVGINAVSPEYEQLDIVELRQAIDAERETLYQQVDQFVYVLSLYTYDTLSDDELQRYIDFLETEAGQWYIDTFLHAYTQPLVDASMEIGVGMKRALQAGKPAESL